MLDLLLSIYWSYCSGLRSGPETQSFYILSSRLELRAVTHVTMAWGSSAIYITLLSCPGHGRRFHTTLSILQDQDLVVCYSAVTLVVHVSGQIPTLSLRTFKALSDQEFFNWMLSIPSIEKTERQECNWCALLGSRAILACCNCTASIRCIAVGNAQKAPCL